jgi:hypothetical protein
MRIVIFGAAGRAGSAILSKALQDGYLVTAFVRSPSRMTIKHANLTVLQGDASNPPAVEYAVRGMDAVVSTMASAASQKIAKNKPLTSGTKNIIDAMKKHGVKRLIITAPNSIPQPQDIHNIRFKLLNSFVKFILPASYDDSVSSIETIQASDTDWTVVRMGRASYGAPTGLVKAGNVNKNTGIFITRDDAAAFILNELKDRKFLRKIPAIYSCKKVGGKE